MTRIAIRTCPLCEATCGLAIELDGDRVVSIRGDREDVFSQGCLCPKGALLGELDADPDRLSFPRIRRDGALVEATWDEAFEEVATRLGAIRAEHGNDAVAIYLGNPNAHTLAGQLYNRPLIKALRTKNVHSASSVDQLPKHVACGLLFGDPLAISVPDIDRTELLVILGGNPRVSNGSLWTAPDLPGRLTGLRRRGGRLVVVDPKRTRTAEQADRHLAIRPGTDVLLLAAIIHTVAADGLVRIPGHLHDPVRHERLVDGGRRQPHDRKPRRSWWGGVPRPAHHRPPRRPFRMNRWQSRVVGLPEAIGELAGRVVATSRQRRPVHKCDHTPCRRDPAAPHDPGAVAHGSAFAALSVRNVANYSPPAVALPDDRLDEWEILLSLSAIAAGMPPPVDIDAADRLVAQHLATSLVRDPTAWTWAHSTHSFPERSEHRLAVSRSPRRDFSAIWHVPSRRSRPPTRMPWS